MDDIAWIKEGLVASRKTQTALAKHLNVSHSQVTRLLQGKRRLQWSEAQVISDFLGVHPPFVPIILPRQQDQGANIMGTIADGLWREDAAGEFKAEPPRPRAVVKTHPDAEQVAFRLDQPVADGFFPAGCYLICLRFSDIGRRPTAGDHVVTRRTRPGLHSWVFAKMDGIILTNLAPSAVAAGDLEIAQTEFLVVCVQYDLLNK